MPSKSEPLPAGHRHHWQLETPHGTRYIDGTCRYCGQVRAFAAGDDTGQGYWNGKGNPMIQPRDELRTLENTMTNRNRRKRTE